MKKKTIAMAVFSVVSLSILFFSCADKTKIRQVVFAVGGTPNEIAFWETLAGEFSAQEGIGVSIIRQPTDTDQRRQGLVVSLKAQKASPDVFLMDAAWIGQFAVSEWLEPLDAYIENSQMNTEIFFQSVLEQSGMYGGNLIAFPVYIDGGVLYYRKDLLDKYKITSVPGTWENLRDIALRIQQSERKNNPGFYGFVWQGAQYEGLICNYLEFAGSEGGIRLDEEPSVNNAANRTALKLMADMIGKDKISPPNTYTEMKEEEVRIFFQQGNALFARNWPYAWPLHQSADSPVAGKIGIAPLPRAAEGKAVSTMGGWHIAVSRFSKAKQDSWKFIRFVTSYETQKKLACTLGWNPGRKDIYSDPEIIKKMPHLQALQNVFENAVARPDKPYYTIVSEILQKQINAALSGAVTPETGLKNAEKEIQTVKSRYEK